MKENAGASAPRRAKEAAIRVMAWPAFANRRENPYNWLLYSELISLGVDVDEFSVQRLLFGPRASILHLHWAPTTRIRGETRARVMRTASVMLLLLAAARARGMKIVWTAHNLGAHDRPAYPDIEQRYWSLVAGYLDAIFSLSQSGVELLRERYPALRDVPAFVTKHGHYRDAYPHDIGRDQARARLGITSEARVVSFIGQVRPYKNLPALLRAFRGIDDPNAVLLIAGKLKLGDQRAELNDLVAADPRVRIFGEFIEPDEIQLYLSAADLVALPFRETLNSGSAILALSFDRPVLVPRLGSLTDLARDAGNEWVMTYEGELTTRALSQALQSAAGKRGQRAPLQHLEWRRIAQQTRDIYRSLLP